MKEKETAPEIIVFAGPNESGKSTFMKYLKPEHMDYINADEIKKVLKCSDIEAAQLAENSVSAILTRWKSFASKQYCPLTGIFIC